MLEDRDVFETYSASFAIRNRTFGPGRVQRGTGFPIAGSDAATSIAFHERERCPQPPDRSAPESGVVDAAQRPAANVARSPCGGTKPGLAVCTGADRSKPGPAAHRGRGPLPDNQRQRI